MAKKERRRFNTNLVGGNAALRITVDRKDPRSVVTFVTHVVKDKTGKRTTTKGASSTHSNVEGALKKAEELAAAALKAGWKKKTPKTAAARPDAFDVGHLPRPPAA